MRQLLAMCVGSVSMLLVLFPLEAAACTTSAGQNIPDAPANTSTTCNLPLAFLNSDGAGNGDHDWYFMNFVSGTSYRIHAWCTGFNCSDTALKLRNSAGAVVVTNDNASIYSLNSIISYTAPTSGKYYLDVATAGVFTSYAVTRTLAIPSISCRAGSRTGFNRGTIHYGYITRNSKAFVEYCLPAAKGMYINIDLRGKPGAAVPLGSLVAKLVDSRNVELASVIIGGNHSRRFGPFPEAGPYYFRVSAQFPGSDWGDYRLIRAE